MPNNTLTRVITTNCLALLASVAVASEEGVANWSLLELASVREVTDGAEWRAEKTFPDELRAAAQGFEISGYYVPVVAEAYVQTFLLVPDPANCPFCGDGGYGPVLEVTTHRPVPDMLEFAPVTLEGTLEFNEATDTFQMFRLVDARVID